jgi:hypothetical protein
MIWKCKEKLILSKEKNIKNQFFLKKFETLKKSCLNWIGAAGWAF